MSVILRVEYFLNAFARTFETVVLGAHPEWAQYIYPYTKWTDTVDPQDELYLWFPSKGDDCHGIELASWRGKVRCSWGEHSPDLSGDTDEAIIRRGITFVEDVLRGDLQVVVLQSWHSRFTKSARSVLVDSRLPQVLKGKVLRRVRWPGPT